MQNWKTTAAGILSGYLGAVGPLTAYLAANGNPSGAKVAGALTCAGIIARVWLGLIQNDAPPPLPNLSSSVPGTTKLGVIALISLLLIPMCAGCTARSVAQDIVNWTPALDSAASTISTLDAALLPEATAFIALSNAIDAEAKAYLATPTATVLQRLQAAVVTAQQQINVALLDAVKIGRTQAGAAHVVATLQTYLTIVNTILALVTSISTKAQVAAMAAASPVKLARVLPYEDYGAATSLIAAHYRICPLNSFEQIVNGQTQLMQAGF